MHCPCGSNQDFAACCEVFLNGSSLPETAEQLMRSRYSAFALSLAEYIMATTHPNNSDYTEDKENWRKSILNFSQTTRFLGLKISEFIDGKEEAFVTFEAQLDHGMLKEKSRFLKVEGKWLYESGEFI